jgi:hypothetical protein
MSQLSHLRLLDYARSALQGVSQPQQAHDHLLVGLAAL